MRGRDAPSRARREGAGMSRRLRGLKGTYDQFFAKRQESKIKNKKKEKSSDRTRPFSVNSDVSVVLSPIGPRVRRPMRGATRHQSVCDIIVRHYHRIPWKSILCFASIRRKDTRLSFSVKPDARTYVILMNVESSRRRGMHLYGRCRGGHAKCTEIRSGSTPHKRSCGL